MLLRLVELLIGLLDVLGSCSYMHVKSLKFFSLVLDLDINVLCDIVDISHNIFYLIDFVPSLLDDSCHVIYLSLHLQVLIVLYSELLLIGSLKLAITILIRLALAVGSQLEVVLLLLLNGVCGLIESVGQLFQLLLESIYTIPLQVLHNYIRSRITYFCCSVTILKLLELHQCL